MMKIDQKINLTSQIFAGILTFTYYLSLSTLADIIPIFSTDHPINGGVLTLIIALSFYPTKEILTTILNRRLGYDATHISRERQNMAYDLHDTVLQNLHRAQLNLARIGNQQQLVEVIALDLQKAINQTRAICLNLSCKKGPLNEAVQDLVDDQLPNLSTTCTINLQEESLDRQVQKHIYGIIREAITNIAKHAQAERAEIRLDVLPDEIHLFIQDDGIGFDRKTVKKEQLGLKSIRSRVSQLNGTYELQSKPGSGTAHWIYIPR